MRIIETCPECGHDLVDLLFATYSTIPRKKCYNCGWEWTGERGEREKVVRVPFGGNTYTNTTDSDAGFDSSPCKNCLNNSKNGGSGVCHCTLGLPKITC